MALRILSIVLPVFLIALLGYVYGRCKRPDMSVVNQINMDVFVPALVFYALSRKEFEFADYSLTALAAAMVVLGSGLLAYPVARLSGLNWRTFVPPMMFTNAGNLGLPLFVLAFGDAALSIAVVFLVVENILHFTLGRYLLDHRLQAWHVLRSPVVLATIFGLAFSVLDLDLPQALSLPIEMVGSISIPLLLFSLGVRLVDIDWGEWGVGLFSAMVCPATGRRLDRRVAAGPARSSGPATDPVRGPAPGGVEFSVCRAIPPGTGKSGVYCHDRQPGCRGHDTRGPLLAFIEAKACKSSAKRVAARLRYGIET